jgi:hypothetical protein
MGGIYSTHVKDDKLIHAFNRKTERKRPGRVDNIKMELGEIEWECVNWIQMT